MPAYQMPPWVGQPADPAAHYQAGFQIGVHLGAQQAAQAFQQQQMAMQERRQLMAQQEQEVQNQMQAQVLNLKASEAARQHQANQIYAMRVGRGEDPSRVLMELAPELGESPTAIMRNQAMIENARANREFRQANMQRLESDFQTRLAETKAEKEQAMEEHKAEFQQREARLKSNAASRIRQAAENAVMRDAQIKQLRDTAAQLQSTISAIGSEGYSIMHPTRTAAVRADEKAAAQKSLQETLAEIANREREIRNHFQTLAAETDTEDPNFNPDAWQVPAPNADIPSADAGEAAAEPATASDWQTLSGGWKIRKR